MREILVVNPRKKRRAKKTTKRKTTTRRRKTTRRAAPKRKRSTTRRRILSAPRRRTTRRVSTMAKRRKSPKRRATKNPKRRRAISRAARSVARRGKAGFAGLNFKKGLQNVCWMNLGMFGAKFGAKLMTPDATETDPTTWNWTSYVKGSIGAVVAGGLVNMVKSGKGQKVMEGGLAYIMFKAVQNELIVTSPGFTNWLGAAEDDDDDYVPTEYLLTGDNMAYNQYGEMYPADDRHRMPEIEEMDGYGSALEPVGPLGSALEPVGPLGADPWAEAYF